MVDAYQSIDIYKVSHDNRGAIEDVSWNVRKERHNMRMWAVMVGDVTA